MLTENDLKALGEGVGRMQSVGLAQGLARVDDFEWTLARAEQLLLEVLRHRGECPASPAERLSQACVQAGDAYAAGEKARATFANLQGPRTAWAEADEQVLKAWAADLDRQILSAGVATPDPEG